MNTDTKRAHLTVDSPVGPLTLVATDGTLCGLYMHDQQHRPTDDAFGEADGDPFTQIVEQLDEYFDGRRRQFEIATELTGTPFQVSVWNALGEIPYGRTASYGHIARAIGRESAFRAVGLAVGRNPIGIVIPCHRVVGSTGSLTGYAGGLDRKQHLLALEHDLVTAE